MTRGLGIGVMALALAACPSKAPQTTGVGSGGTSGSASPDTSACDRLHDKVAGLYRTEATTREPERIDQATADNTAMVLGECRLDPGRVAPCVERVTTIAELETQCLARLDDEGTEGEALRK